MIVCVRLLYGTGLPCAAELADHRARCLERHAKGEDGCCTHGFELCVHGECELECSAERSCTASLAHEYACFCPELGCSCQACRGDCGCQGCHAAYMDFLDFLSSE